MKLGDPLPSLDRAASWIHPQPSATELAGHAVLVHFWSLRCPLCHEGMHAIERIRSSFALRGLVTIAVHQPRSDEPADEIAARRIAAHELHVDYACAFDRDGTLAAAFESEFAPGYYYFDAGHRLRHRQMGNAGLNRLHELIDRTP